MDCHGDVPWWCVYWVACLVELTLSSGYTFTHHQDVLGSVKVMLTRMAC